LTPIFRDGICGSAVAIVVSMLLEGTAQLRPSSGREFFSRRKPVCCNTSSNVPVVRILLTVLRQKSVPSQKIVPPAWESLDSGGCQYEKIVIIADFKKD